MAACKFVPQLAASMCLHGWCSVVCQVWKAGKCCLALHEMMPLWTRTLCSSPVWFPLSPVSHQPRQRCTVSSVSPPAPSSLVSLVCIKACSLSISCACSQILVCSLCSWCVLLGFLVCPRFLCCVLLFLPFCYQFSSPAIFIVCTFFFFFFFGCWTWANDCYQKKKKEDNFTCLYFIKKFVTYR